MNIDDLNIQIKSDARTATSAISSLTQKLLELSGALSSVNPTTMSRLSTSLDAFSSAAQGLSNVKTADFTRLIKNLKGLADLNGNGIRNSAQAIETMSASLSSLQGLSLVGNEVASVVNAINKFGLKNTERAIQNLPKLAENLETVMNTLSKAPHISENTLQFMNSLGLLASQGQKTGTAVRSLTNGLKAYNNTTEKSLSLSTRLAVAIGKFNLIYYTVRRVASAMWSLVDSASETYEALNYFNQAMNKVAESSMNDWNVAITEQMAKAGYTSAQEYYDSFSDRLSSLLEQMTGYDVSNKTLKLKEMQSLGLNIAEMSQHSSAFLQMADSIGMVGESALNTSKALSMLAADWSSLKNIKVEDALLKMESALAGQSRAVRALGIDITQNALQELAWQLGIEKSVTLMTQEEKSILRVISMLQQSKVAYGDLAKTIESPANQARLLQAQLSNLAMTVGSILLPAVQGILPYITGFTVALNRMLYALGEWLGVDWSQTVTSITEYETAYDDLADSIDDTANAQKKLNAQLRAWDEINNITTTKKNASDVGKDSEVETILNQTLADALEEYEKKWNDSFDNMTTKAETFAQAIQNTMGKLVSIIHWENIAEAINKVWSAIKKFATETLSGFFTFIEKVTLPALGVALDAFSGALKLLSDVILLLPPQALEALGGALAGVLSVFYTYKITSNIVSGITNAFKSIDEGTKIVTAASMLHPFGIFVSTLSAFIGACVVLGETARDNRQIEIYGDSIGGLVRKYNNAIRETENKSLALDIKYDDALLEGKALDELWDKYKNLANAVGDSAEKQKLLKDYAEELVDKIPELKGYIDEETGAFKDQWEEIELLIAKQKELYRVQAAEEIAKEKIRLQIELEVEKDELDKSVELAKERYEEALAEMDAKYPLSVREEWAKSGVRNLPEDFLKLHNAVRETYAEYEKLIGASNDVGKEISVLQAEIDKYMKIATNGLEDYGKAYGDTTDKITSYAKELSEKFTGYTNGMRKTLTNFVTTSKKTPLEIAQGLLSGNKEIEKAGNELSIAFGNGIVIGSRFINQKVVSITTDIKTALSIQDETKAIGEEIGFGVIQGLDNAQAAIEAKAKSIVGGAISVMNSILGSASIDINIPSVSTVEEQKQTTNAVNSIAGAAVNKNMASTVDNSTNLNETNELLRQVASNTANNNVYLDGKKIAQNTVNHMNDFYRANGRSMVLN